MDIVSLESLSKLSIMQLPGWPGRPVQKLTEQFLPVSSSVVDGKISVVLQGVLNSFWKGISSLLCIFFCKVIETWSTLYLSLNLIWSWFCYLWRNLGREKTFWCIVGHIRGLVNLVLCLLDYPDCEVDRDGVLSGLYNAVVTSWFLGTPSGIASWASECTHPNLDAISQPVAPYGLLVQQETESQNTDVGSVGLLLWWCSVPFHGAPCIFFLYVEDCTH